VDAIQRVVSGFSPGLRVRAHFQVLPHRQGLEHLSSLRDMGDPQMRPLCRRTTKQIWPMNEIRPATGSRIPEIVLNKVDFPAPFGPTTVTNWPSFTDNVTWRSTLRPP
jgi:hypothetical protein